MSQSVAEYLENPKNPRHRHDLAKIRAFVQEQLPEAVEDMRYGMPTYSLNGHVVVALASQKHYLSLYMDVELVETYRSQLSNLNCGKSCIRFKNADDLPLGIIAKMLQETVDKQSALD